VYAVLVVVVIGMCPIIMFSSEALASDIQKYTQTLVHKTTELNIEKHKADTLIFQVCSVVLMSCPKIKSL
jgi:hypothetical protein